MSGLLHAGALLCAVAAVVAGCLVAAATRQVRTALLVLLDLLLAAALLRLSAGASWAVVAGAAAFVAVRHLAGVRLRGSWGDLR